MEFPENNDDRIDPEHHSTVATRMAHGRQLFRAAWIFEIAAATIGLFVAWTTGNNIAALEGNVSPEQRAQIILGALPFVMVALAELLKIPIVYLVYVNRNIITKVFFSIILFGLTLITFETLASAFENQFTNIIQKVQGPQEDIHYKTNIILTLKGKVKATEGQTLESLNVEQSRNITTLNQIYIDKENNLKFQRDTIILTLVKGKEERLEFALNNINELANDRDAKLDRLQNNYNQAKKMRDEGRVITVTTRDTKIKLINKEIETLHEIIKDHDKKAKGTLLSWCKNDKECKKNFIRLDNLNIKKQEIIGLNSINDENQFFNNYQRKVRQVGGKYNSQISELKVLINNIREDILNQKENDLRLKNINKQLENILTKHNENIEQTESTHKSDITLFNINKGKIQGWRSLIDSKEEEVEKLTESMKEFESATQIYRFTKYRMGVESVVEVTLDDVTTTAFWWYGSLATLVSIMGVVLAFGAQILTNPKPEFHDPRSKKYHRLTSSLRRMLISLRRRIREPKIITKTRIKEVPKVVIKEVPVQKVVLTEVPKVVTRIEEVYVPRYSDDKILLKLGTAGYVRDIIRKFGKSENKKTKKDSKKTKKDNKDS